MKPIDYENVMHAAIAVIRQAVSDVQLQFVINAEVADEVLRILELISDMSNALEKTGDPTVSIERILAKLRNYQNETGNQEYLVLFQRICFS